MWHTPYGVRVGQAEAVHAEAVHAEAVHAEAVHAEAVHVEAVHAPYGVRAGQAEAHDDRMTTAWRPRVDRMTTEGSSREQ